jgi:phage terminase large subunit-like protein
MRTFIPKERIKQKEASDGVEYSRWIKEGWMIPCEGLTINNEQIEKFIFDFVEENDLEILELDYDPYSSTQVGRHFEEKGYIAVEIRQGMRTLSEPTKDFREQVYNKNILHENNPVLNWNVQNAVEKADKNYNIQLDKSSRTKKIDGLAATINAHVRAISHFTRERENQSSFDINKQVDEKLLNKMWGLDQ